MKPEVAYCHMLASVVAADGKMDDRERILLERVMGELGLTEEERDAVTHFEGVEEAESVLETLSQDVKEQLRDDMLAATLADGEVSKLERDQVERITKLMGL